MRVLPVVTLAFLWIPAPAPRQQVVVREGHFTALPLGAIRPAGWLRRQLEIQATGLSGHLDEFWPDLGARSGWLGGDGESWERGPYFLDGLVPLAFLLDDGALTAKARKWIEWTIRSQRPDGSIGPVKNQDWWPNMVMLKALMQYADATGDRRVAPLMERYFAYHLKHASSRPLKEWARARWFEELPAILWLYGRTKNAALIELARTLHGQGFDWRSHFEAFTFTGKTRREDLGHHLQDRALSAHGVNNAMALKALPLWFLFSGDESDRALLGTQLAALDRHHGLPNGMFSADEHYAGRDPSQGIELCAVVEAMYSLELALAVLGDPALGDRLEKIAYNALPAAFSYDMWSHQYDQQPNQVMCTLAPRDWTTNGPESNLFGLEPHFGCCTANMHQGWPKLAAHLWMRTADGGFAAAAYGQSEVRTTVKGVPIVIREQTEYPFRDTVTVDLAPERPVAFPLTVRVPGWAIESTLQVNDQASEALPSSSWRSLRRTWRKGDRVTVVFRMRPRVTRAYRNSVVIERGPLVFALPIGEEWRRITGGMKRPALPPAADWEVHPTTAWNYGLLEDGIAVVEKPLGRLPFSAADAPVSLRVHGRRLPNWGLASGSAGPMPESPVESGAPLERLTLVPYGAAKLRVTAFPRLSH